MGVGAGSSPELDMAPLNLVTFLGWFLPLCSGADLRLSYEQLLRDLQTPEASYDNSGPVVMMKPVMKSRPQIITWRDFPQDRRQEKSGLLEVPEPFTISTGITVTQKGEREAREGRRKGRSYSPVSMARPARWLGGNLARAVAIAPTIEGERRPDDETDRVVHRGGRFINNVFVPSGSVPPREVQVRATFGGEAGKASGVNNQGRTSWARLAPGHLEDQQQWESEYAGRPLRRSGRSYSQYVEDNAEYSQTSNFVEDDPNPRQPSFAFRDFYSGRRQEQQDADAMESQQDAVFVPAPEKTEASEPVYFLTEKSEASEEPVYFLNGDPDSLHADRSPYTFEPAGQAGQGPPAVNVPNPGALSSVVAASNDDFVIKQHTYQMCPNCPTFSIPIPVPKSAASQSSEVVNPYTIDPGYEYQHGEEPESLFSKLSSLLSPIIASARASLAPLLGDNSDTTSNSLGSSTFSDRLSTVGSPSTDNGPLLMAGMAAAGLGVAALLSSSIQLLSLGGGVARAFGEQQEEESNSVGGDSLGGALAEYNMQDILCMPRVYCEKMKRRKHVIDQYPNTKKVAAWLVGRLFDRDTVYSKEEEEPIYNKCNLRECLLALLD